MARMTNGATVKSTSERGGGHKGSKCTWPRRSSSSRRIHHKLMPFRPASVSSFGVSGFGDKSFWWDGFKGPHCQNPPYMGCFYPPLIMAWCLTHPCNKGLRADLESNMFSSCSKHGLLHDFYKYSVYSIQNWWRWTHVFGSILSKVLQRVARHADSKIVPA